MTRTDVRVDSRPAGHSGLSVTQSMASLTALLVFVAGVPSLLIEEHAGSPITVIATWCVIRVPPFMLSAVP